jgi:hypothetical protein
MEYLDFLASKAPRVMPSGLAVVPTLHPALKPHQRDCVAFGLKLGRWGCFLDTGLGKTLTQLEWCKHAAAATNGRALILTPLAVAAQIVREGHRFGYDVRQIRDQSQAGPGINVCNYDRLDLLTPAEFGAVALDECFARGTLIDTPEGGKHIEDIRPGDHILNCTGVDRVSDVHRREVPYAVLVKVTGASFIASPNHPVFTQRGWVGAQHLRAGDHALATRASLRLVRDSLCAEIPRSVRPEILRDILLSEMADDAERNFSEGPFAGGRSEAGGKATGLASIRPAGRCSRAGEDHESEPVREAGGSGEDFGCVESHEPRTIRAWGQWSGADIAASVDAGCTWERMGSGVSVITGPKEARIPNMLQVGLRQSAIEGRHRSGWCLTSGSKAGNRPEAGCDDCFIGVEGIEVLEPGDHRLEQLRDADGKLYFYDLGATRHPSYSVAGVLVHNSSILKSFTGRTTRHLIDAFAGVRFRMAATATPAPNDHMELGNHAEFLGIMSSTEMLTRFFINDTANASQKWRIKRHAEADFWDWMASWCRMAETPADLGHDASEYVLPPLRVHRHKAAGDIRAPAGLLFAQDVSATNMYAVKRETAGARAEMLASIIPQDGPVLIWCDTDDEADAICKAVPEAVEVRGSMTAEMKEARLTAFSLGQLRVLVTKSKIAGFGMNWQHCQTMIFAGRSFSYEAWYQAVRRCWRFGQTRPVDCHLIVAEGEDQIGRVIDRKSADHTKMKRAMAAAMKRAGREDKTRIPYQPTYTGRLPAWV